MNSQYLPQVDSLVRQVEPRAAWSVEAAGETVLVATGAREWGQAVAAVVAGILERRAP